MKPGDLKEFQKAIGYTFHAIDLLHMALTHPSLKTPRNPGYERLEFIGDAVLGLSVSEYLFHYLPFEDEGELTRVKSIVVSRPVLARKARELNLNRYISCAKCVPVRGRLPDSVLAASLEALIGAIYLDAGMETAAQFILKYIIPEIEKVLRDEHEKDFKSLLQQFTQQHYSLLPQYRLVSCEGPDHSKRFCVVVSVKDEEFGPAWGKTKKDSEQKAARMALEELMRRKGKN